MFTTHSMKQGWQKSPHFVDLFWWQQQMTHTLLSHFPWRVACTRLHSCVMTSLLMGFPWLYQIQKHRVFPWLDRNFAINDQHDTMWVRHVVGSQQVIFIKCKQGGRPLWEKLLTTERTRYLVLHVEEQIINILNNTSYLNLVDSSVNSDIRLQTCILPENEDASPRTSYRMPHRYAGRVGQATS